MSSTVHFIEDWETKNCVSPNQLFPPNHIGEHIAEAPQDALTNWKLDEKGPVAITTDNGSNVVNAVQVKK